MLWQRFPAASLAISAIFELLVLESLEHGDFAHLHDLSLAKIERKFQSPKSEAGSGNKDEPACTGAGYG